MYFFHFSHGKSVFLSNAGIEEALADLPSDSDISGGDDDSLTDETWLPRDQQDAESSDDNISADLDVGPDGDGREDAIEVELPDLDQSEVPLITPGRPGPSVPGPAKRFRSSGRERRDWQWEKADLEPKSFPSSNVKAKNLGNCIQDVQFFMAMLGEENVTLLTIQSNMVRVKVGIERNRTFPAISEREMRQWIGLSLYMSVIQKPSTHLYWNLELRNEAIASVMTRDRYRQISSVVHLSDNDLQPGRGSPDYDKLYKVREFLNNLSTNFEDYADYEEVMSVDEMMIPYKGQLGLKVYMKNKPSKWGIKVWGLAGQSGYIYRFNICGDNRLLMTAQQREELEVGI